MNEIDFTSLKNNFNTICNQVNEDKETVTLTLKNNRKVYIMSEDSYDSIDRFFITSFSSKKLASR